MLEDLRSAVRSVVRARGLTAVLLVSLALGTGANAAVCGIVYRLLLGAPDGVRSAGELVSIFTSEYSGAPYGKTSLPDFASIVEATSPESIAAFDDSGFANVALVPDRSEPEADAGDPGTTRGVRVTAVTGRFFATLEMRAHAGTLIDEADATLQRPAAVISFQLAEELDTPATIVGRTLSIGTRNYTIAGVGPRRFRGLAASRPSDVWIPLDDQQAGRGDRRLSVIARVPQGSDAINSRLTSLSAQLAQEYPETNRGTVGAPEAPRQLIALPYSRMDPGSRSEASIIAALGVSVVALLLVGACVNAGTLLLSRAMARRREVAVKMALGARRAALARQLLFESLVISFGGGALGMLVATWVVRAVPALFSPDHAALLDTDLDALLATLTLGVATVAGVGFGIAPAIQGTGASATLALRADSGGVSERHGGTRMRGVLITTQLAVSTLLLIATSLLVDGLSKSLSGDAGGDTGRVAMFAMQNPGGNCNIYDPVRGVRFHHALAEALPKLPGVIAVGWAGTAPLGRSNVREFAVQAGAKAIDRVEFNVTVVSPNYFGAMGIPMIEGRGFDDADSALSGPVAVVDELLARRHFGRSAVGQHLVTADGEAKRIVGVVRTGRYRTLQDSPDPTVYLPYSQEHLPCGFLLVRTASDPEPMFAAVASRLTRIDPGVTITRTTTLERHLSEALAIDRLTTTLIGLCAVIAVLLAMVGVYGVMSDAVLRRTREIGLRVALGAGRRQVVKLLWTEASSLIAAGVGLGVGVAVVLERVTASFVHGLPGLSASTLAVAPAILVVVVVVASLPPLRRALAVSPTVALRAE